MGKKKKEEVVEIHNYDFTVNKKAKIPVHRDQYELEVSNMHGDADHYSTTNAYFDLKSEESAKRLYMWLSFFDHLKELGYPDRDYIEEILKSYLKKYEEEIGEYEPEEEDWGYWDGIRELVESDATADNQYICRPTLKAVYYHDTYGVKQEVKFKKK